MCTLLPCARLEPVVQPSERSAHPAHTAGAAAPTSAAVATGTLADHAFAALEILLHGFEVAAGRDGDDLLRELEARPDDPISAGLRAVVLRLVFMLYAEARGLLPVAHPVYAARHGVRALFTQLQSDLAAHGEAMARRFGAWLRLLATWRAIHGGVDLGDLHVPARGGAFFDPDSHPFLEGRRPGERSAARAPGVDDRTVHDVLAHLLHRELRRPWDLELEVEQLGGVYEALMGYHVVRLSARAACLKPPRARGVWVCAAELSAVPAARRAAWLRDHAGLGKHAATRLAAAFARAPDEDAGLAVLAAARVRHSELRGPGRLVLQPGGERRRTSSHYTPRSLTGPIVERTLAPLLTAIGPAPTARDLLALRICDPAMGSGAFLIEVVRHLGDQLVAAWTRAGEAHQDVVMHARRLVAGRCVYGVDKNPVAVELARLSLWLATSATDLPFTFVDHALRHGDSLVGLRLDQLRGFHWDPAARVEPVAAEVERGLAEAASLHHPLAGRTDADVDARARLRHAAAATARARLIADLVVGAFFSRSKARDREQERRRRLDLVVAWLADGGPPPPELSQLQAQLHARLPTFHWPLEFPHVFHPARADDLAGVHACVGNPPFAGKNSIVAAGGPHYLDWLQAVHSGAHGNADLSAHFFRRADALLAADGTIGLIATNTIGEGDTRATGLRHLVAVRGYTIHDATRGVPWPEAGAAVTISIVHLARGRPAAALARPQLHDPDPDDSQRLLTRTTAAIDSRLRPTAERPDPQVLARNAGLGFVGSYVLGMGFILTPAERAALIARSDRNAERISPYLGGEEVNTNPDQGFDRYVINFGAMALAQAEAWPDLLQIVRERVKPERDRNNREVRRRCWWRFGEVAPALYEAIRPLTRCLVTGIVSKHVSFSFQPTDRVFSHKLFVLPLAGASAFAALQSRVHVQWSWLLSSTMSASINYSASDCFETFPFPRPDPRAEIAALEQIGERLDTARAASMRAARQGLTSTYNALKDPACADPAIVALRDLHVELDRAVLRAYGWHDIEVPPYTTPRTPAERLHLATFEDAVQARLFALNAERAAEERRLGLRHRPPAR